VIVRVACLNCGYENVTVSAKGKESDIKCYRCFGDVEVISVLREIGSAVAV
jgi:hypothetical protein